MIFLYQLLMTILLLLVYPVALIMALFGKRSLLARLRAPKITASGDGLVWIHAASMGEAGIAYSLASEIKSRHPKRKIAVSIVTSTGLDRINSLNKNADSPVIDFAFSAPFDHPLIVESFVRAMSPGLFILVETELWPSLILALGKSSVPIAIINGKLGKKSFKRYYMLKRSFQPLADKISLLCAQTRIFSSRFRRVGVRPSRIEVIGNVKFDGLPDSDAYKREEVRAELGLSPHEPVIVAGSTRPGEEDILLDSFQSILDDHPSARLVIAPRHLNRLPEIESLIKSKNVSYSKRSDGAKAMDNSTQVLILDTMGELLRAFASADIAFVGGSLGDYGGHNPLEPAALGIPVIFGPFMEQTGSKELLSEGAASLVHDREELTEILKELIPAGDRHKRMADAGPRAVSRFKGTLKRTVMALEKRDLL